MNKLTFILLASLLIVVACDRDMANEEETIIKPEDISSAAQEAMFQMVFDYNQCMVECRLLAQQEPEEEARRSANNMMDTCEVHIDELKVHLLAHKVDESLVMEMTKQIRSRAARKLLRNL